MNNQYIERGYQSLSVFNLESNALENFEIYFFDDVTKESLKDFQMLLLKLNSINPNREIVIYINSYGGEVTSGLAMYDLMNMISNPIRTVCIGMAASMSALLFASGDRREVLPHAQIMIHDPLVREIGGSALVIKQMSDNLLNIRSEVATILAKHTGKSVEEILENTRQDHYFTATEAVEFGLADKVLNNWNK